MMTSTGLGTHNPSSMGSQGQSLGSQDVKQQLTDIRAWIAALTSEILPESEREFLHALRNGTVLCRLANEISSGIVPRIAHGDAASCAEENLLNFTKACRTLGVTESRLFNPGDIIDRQQVGPVLNCLMSLRERSNMSTTSTTTAKSPQALQEELRKHLEALEHNYFLKGDDNKTARGAPPATPPQLSHTLSQPALSANKGVAVSPLSDADKNPLNLLQRLTSQANLSLSSDTGGGNRLDIDYDQYLAQKANLRDEQNRRHQALTALQAAKSMIFILKNSYQAQLERKENIIEELKNTIQKDEELKMSALKNKAALLENQLRTLEAEYSELKKKIEERKDEKKSDASVQKLKDEAEKEKRRYEALVNDLRGELQTMTDENKRLQTHIEASATETDRAREEITTLLEERKSFEEQLGAAPAGGTLSEEAKETIRSAHNEVTTLSQSFRELQKSSRNRIAEVESTLGDVMTYANKLVADFSDEMTALRTKYEREARLRKKYFNEVQELKGNIRVFCRVRPIFSWERDQGLDTSVTFPFDNEIQVYNPQHNNTKHFEFDRVFDYSSNQEDVFSDAEGIVTSVLDGYNACIFAYGQTGSGKTYTMIGPEDDRGVNYRALQRLFEIVEERKEEADYEISISLLEIYNEMIRDLLDHSPPPAPHEATSKLEIRQGPNGMYVPDLTVRNVETVKQVWDFFDEATQNRAVGVTNLNEHSSRSHALLGVRVVSTNKITGLKLHGKLTLVDLAGSERLSKSQATGQRMKETQHINKSLLALGDVVSALTTKQAHVPYRNSKLTYLLQDSLGGDSKTMMFVQVSPAHPHETICSLSFAARARNIELGQAKKNVENPDEVEKVKQMLTQVVDEKKSTEGEASSLRNQAKSAEMKAKQKEQQAVQTMEKLKVKEKEMDQLKSKQDEVLRTRDQEILRLKKEMDKMQKQLTKEQDQAYKVKEDLKKKDEALKEKEKMLNVLSSAKPVDKGGAEREKEKERELRDLKKKLALEEQARQQLEKWKHKLETGIREKKTTETDDDSCETPLSNRSNSEEPEDGNGTSNRRNSRIPRPTGRPSTAPATKAPAGSSAQSKTTVATTVASRPSTAASSRLRTPASSGTNKGWKF